MLLIFSVPWLVPLQSLFSHGLKESDADNVAVAVAEVPVLMLVPVLLVAAERSVGVVKVGPLVSEATAPSLSLSLELWDPTTPLTMTAMMTHTAAIDAII